MSNHSSSFPTCFRPSSSAATKHLPPPSTPPPTATTSGNPNLSTSLYQTELGLFSLTWSRTFFSGHSLHLHLHPSDGGATAGGGCFSPLSLSNPPSLSIVSFHLHIKPFLFWKKYGSKTLNFKNQESNNSVPRIQIFWDLSKAKFGSGPEPVSGFYIAVVVDREMVLLVGDLTKQSLSKTRARKPPGKGQVLVLRREHVYGDRVYATKARFGGKTRDVVIACTTNSDGRLIFSVDNKKVLQIKRLKWKFRGNERIEVDGVPIQISWDVYNWLFEDSNNGHAIFMFRFEDIEEIGEEEGVFSDGKEEAKSGAIVPWQQNYSCSSSFGMSGIEWRKMRRNLIRTTRSSSSSSISMSSATSVGSSSSIMEWASTEENELSSPSGFSLIVYAWRK